MITSRMVLPAITHPWPRISDTLRSPRQAARSRPWSMLVTSIFVSWNLSRMSQTGSSGPIMAAKWNMGRRGVVVTLKGITVGE